MNFDGQRYYRVNQFFLEIMGLWPYNNSIYIHIYRAFTISVLASSCITQLAKLQNTVHDLDRLLYNLTYAVPSHIYLLKFLSYIIKIDKVKEMLDRIQHDWNTLKDEKECEIIRYYTMIGMRYTIVFFAASFPFLLCFILGFYLPGFLDFVHPLNESRSRRLPILAEYYILDEQKHFYPILMHQSLLALLGVTTVLATETLNMVCVHHACGLFEVARIKEFTKMERNIEYSLQLSKRCLCDRACTMAVITAHCDMERESIKSNDLILSYRLKHAFDNRILLIPDNEKYVIIRAKIVQAINIHRRSIEFLDYLLSTFIMIYLIMLVLGVIAITINMFRLIEAILTMNDFEELMAAAAFILGQYGFLFFANYFGQKVTDCSILVFDKAYEVPWYTAPIQIQKLLTFILQRTVRGYVLGIGGVIMASLEGFASMASLTLSYLTVIYSVR